MLWVRVMLPGMTLGPAGRLAPLMILFRFALHGYKVNGAPSWRLILPTVLGPGTSGCPAARVACARVACVGR